MIFFLIYLSFGKYFECLRVFSLVELLFNRVRVAKVVPVAMVPER